MPADTTTKKVPIGALRFAAELMLSQAADGLVPVKITARTGKPVWHWFWGTVVHDLAGMKVAKSSIPFDYCHDCEEVLGFGDKYDITTGDLVVTGALIPMPEDPDDRAAEVIYKAGKGVPYEGSIYFDEPLAIEEVAAGATVQVNGYALQGPAVVIRQWTLRGIAICPYGTDSGTSTQFNASAATVEVKLFSNQEANMPADATADVKPADAKPEEKKPEATAAPECSCETKPAEEKQPDAKPAEPAAAAPAAATQLSAASDGAKFLAAFGDKGGVWFAQGKSFAEAEQLFTAELKAEADQLRKQVTELSAQVKAGRGEGQPLSFSAADSPAQEAAKKLSAKVGPNVAKVAAGMNFANRASK